MKKLKAYVSEEILSWHCLSLILNADLCIHFYWLSRLRQASHRKMIQNLALRLWLCHFKISSDTSAFRHLALVRRLFLHKYMSHRNAINLMAFNDIGGSKAKKISATAWKWLKGFHTSLAIQMKIFRFLRFFFSCSFDEFSCKVDSKEGFIMLYFCV